MSCISKLPFLLFINNSQGLCLNLGNHSGPAFWGRRLIFHKFTMFLNLKPNPASPTSIYNVIFKLTRICLSLLVHRALMNSPQRRKQKDVAVHVDLSVQTIHPQQRLFFAAFKPQHLSFPLNVSMSLNPAPRVLIIFRSSEDRSRRQMGQKIRSHISLNASIFQTPITKMERSCVCMFTPEWSVEIGRTTVYISACFGYILEVQGFISNS